MTDRQLNIFLIAEFPLIVAVMLWIFYGMKKVKRDLQQLVKDANNVKDEIEANMKVFQGFSDELENDIDEMTGLENKLIAHLDKNTAFIKGIVENGTIMLTKLKEEVTEQLKVQELIEKGDKRDHCDDKDSKESEKENQDPVLSGEV